MRSLQILILAAAASTWSHQATGHKPCTASSVPIPVTKAKIALTEAQEADLGDAMAEQMERAYAVVHDSANAYLQRIGDRIVAQLPASEIRYRFTLVNVPTVNAFATPGGRIYVTRKLVAFATSEDELAGVLGHEIGHVITRQLAAAVADAFRQTLKVTTFGDREDMFEEYHRLIDAAPSAVREASHVEAQQYEADRVALIAVARAGYSPDAYVTFWDRFSSTNHNTGSVLSDFFASTRPEAKRLREMVHSMDVVPEGCRAVTADSTASFRDWQKRVIETTSGAETNSARGVVREHPLDPPLHADLSQLRFSPDGRFLLAQNDSSVYVLSRQPLTVLFRIDTEDALPAQFTPDGNKVVFHTSGLRVERWDIASRAREGAFELVAPHGALQATLSPDGHLLAYIDLAPAVGVFRIHLLDVDSGSEVFKKEVSSVEGMYLVRYYFGDPRDIEIFELRFSPDGRYFVAGGSHPVVVDLTSKAEAQVSENARNAFRQQFAFLGADRVVTVDAKRSDHSAIVRFPSGEPLVTLTLGGHVSAATHGNALLLRPIKDWPVGLLDLTAGRVTLASKTPALDAYDDTRVSELPNGDIGIFGAASREPMASVTLPVSPLGAVRWAIVSPDLERIAISGRDRGGVWDTTSGHRLVYVHGFWGADVEQPSTLFADFPARKEVRDGKPVPIDRKIARVDLATGSVTDLVTVGEAAADLQGRYYATLIPEKPGEWDRNVTFDVRDVETNGSLWTRRFIAQSPWIHYDVANGRLTFESDAGSAEAKAQIKLDATLRSALDSPDLKNGASLLEVVSLKDGKTLGRLLVATGRNGELNATGHYTRKIQTVVSAGDTVIVLDKSNQAIVYSMSSGKRLGTLFGRFAVMSDPLHLIAIQNNSGELQCYDARTLEHKGQAHLGSRIRLARFSGDGRQLLLVTADQVARVLDTDPLISQSDGTKAEVHP
jgi:predicted Zn-dependent protease